jgi:hypothetical protein
MSDAHEHEMDLNESSKYCEGVEESRGDHHSHRGEVVDLSVVSLQEIAHYYYSVSLVHCIFN